MKMKEIQEKLVMEARERKKMKEENEKIIKENSELFQLENKDKRDKVKELEAKQKQTMEMYK